MITILCSPKPFINEAAWNQINALRSWRGISPDVEIMVFGTAQGAAEAAAEVHAEFVPEIECSPTGAPSFNSMAMHASKYGKFNLQIYVNCDILSDSSMVKALLSGFNRFGKFLLVGERLDLKQGLMIDTRDPGWMDNLDPLVDNGNLIPHGPTGADYFGFTRDMWIDLPPVFMGRAMCDQALLHFCLKRRIHIVNATLAVKAIHQFHDYQHVHGGIQEVFGGDDRIIMARAHGLGHGLPTIADADWNIKENGNIIPVNQQFLRRAELILRNRYGLEYIALAIRAFQYLVDKPNLLPKKMTANSILESWRRYAGRSN